MGANAWAVLVLFDVRNAFNTADWGLMVAKLTRRGCSQHLLNVIMDFFSDRKLLISRGVERATTMGVPQGSILGPVLWNVLFDEVLSLFEDPTINAVAYADDLAMVIEANTKAALITKTNDVMRKIDLWMTNNKLTLATDKTECVVFCGMRRPKDISFKLRNVCIQPKREVKYLGVVIDRLLTFGGHIFYAAEKAERAATTLGRILPNIGGPRSSKRKVMAYAVMNIILYAAPAWAPAMRVGRYKARVLGVQRKLALRITSAYRTVSTEAVLVIAGMIPVHIMAEERKHINTVGGDKKAIAKAARTASLERWQEEIMAASKGEWTRRLINNVIVWHTRQSGEINYFTTQALSGHGNFRTFLRAIGKAESDNCIYCGEIDTPEHAIFFCPREDERRTSAEARLGTLLHPETVIRNALENRKSWSVIFGFMEKTMSRREEDFRRLELNP